MTERMEARETDRTARATTLLAVLEEALAGKVDEERVAEIVAEQVAPLAAAMGEIAKAVKAEAGRTLKVQHSDGRPPVTIKGAHPALAEIVTWLSEGEHVWLVGPAGTGKTTLARHAGEALGYSEERILSVSFTEGVSESQLLGGVNPFGGEWENGPFLTAYEEGGFFVADEVDAADPNCLLALNQATSNGHLPVPRRRGKPMAKRHKDFRLVACANTYGTGANRMYCGRNQMDAAFLDRFAQVEVAYDSAIDAAACGDKATRDAVLAIRAAVESKGVRRVVSPRGLRRAEIAEKNKAILGGWEKVTLAGWGDDEMRAVGITPNGGK